MLHGEFPAYLGNPAWSIDCCWYRKKKHDNSGTSNGKLHFRFGHLSGWCFRVPGSVCWWTGAWKDHTGNQGNTKGESLVTSLGSCLGHHIRRCSCVKAHRTSHMKRFGWGVVKVFDLFLFLWVFITWQRLTQPLYAWLLANLAWYSAIDVPLWIQTIWHPCIYVHGGACHIYTCPVCPPRRPGGLEDGLLDLWCSQYLAAWWGLVEPLQRVHGNRTGVNTSNHPPWPIDKTRPEGCAVFSGGTWW